MNSAVQQSYVDADQLEEILAQAQKLAEDHYLEFTGTVTPQHAWQLFQSGQAVIVDVRTAEERKFVGHIKDTVHIPWASGISLDRNPHFAQDLETQVGKDTLIFLLCRSGKRSAAAANVAFNAGFKSVYNIDQGFEGDLDERQHRGVFNGWRFHDLPWVQD